MSKTKQTFTIDQVKKLTNHDNILIVISGKVYNVTDFLDEHPGGEEVLRDHVGLDSTIDFDDVGHSIAAKELMKEYYIGDLVESSEIISKNQSNNNTTNITIERQNWFPSKYVPFIAISIVILSIGMFYYTSSSGV